MDEGKKNSRYSRIVSQLHHLIKQTDSLVSRMATVNAILYYKMTGFLWTGFYLLKKEDLLVGPYQGPLACQVLEKNKGVCWAAINQKVTLIVPDVEQFPGHIACNPRSKSEIAVPIWNKYGEIIGVLDVDSISKNHFNETDAKWLEKIVSLLHQEPLP